MPKVKSEVEIIKFIPRYDERIWGGRALKEKFDRILPIGVRIGDFTICATDLRPLTAENSRE